MSYYNKGRLFIETAEARIKQPRKYRDMLHNLYLLDIKEEYVEFVVGLRSFLIEWGSVKALETFTGKAYVSEFMELMRAVDNETGYPGNDVDAIRIYQRVGGEWRTVARRKWRGVALTEDVREELEADEGNVIDFGEFGHFEPWEWCRPCGFIDDLT